ncbi:MAG: dicarboxylate/amino acid:cation symporter [Bryobacterales bacterium]
MQLYNKILLGLIGGAAIGAVANFGDIGWLKTILGALDPVGTAFIRALTMVVVPLVTASLIVGAASLGDITKLGRIGGKTFVYYTLTTALAVSMGLLISNIIAPGSGVDPATRDSLSAQYGGQAQQSAKMAAEAPSLVDVVLNMIPRNPLASAAQFDLLPVIFFSVLFGAALSILPSEKRDPVLKVFDGINEASMVIIGWVMKTAPYAVFALIASVISQFGMDLLRSLIVYAFCVVLGLLLHMGLTISFMVRFFAKLNPVMFFRRIKAIPVFAFSTSSSNATLPVTLRTAENELGISKEISSFVLPLGATINMDGTALYQAVAVMFIAQIYGIPMDLTSQATVVLTATLASVGTAGVPSAGIITLIIVLQSVGLGDKVETGIALILGVDRILDMLRTVVNVTGDLSCAAFVARSEGEMLEPAIQASGDRP